MDKKQLQIYALIAAGVVAAYVIYKGSKVVANVAAAINPLNNDNIINQGATSVYQAVTGSAGSIGGDIYDFMHPEAAKGTNVINGMATSIYEKLTGSTGSIGGDLYDWLH